MSHEHKDYVRPVPPQVGMTGGGTPGAQALENKEISDVERLHEMCMRGLFESVKELLQKNPKLVDAPGSMEYTALHHAARSGHCDIVTLLLHAKANVSSLTSLKETALHLAVMKDHADVAATLIKYVEQRRR